MRYSLTIMPHAMRQLSRLPGKQAMRIRDKINALADDPRPPGTVKLTDEDNLYRVRVGDYRIVYRIEDRRLVVLIVRIGHRREVYR